MQLVHCVAKKIDSITRFALSYHRNDPLFHEVDLLGLVLKILSMLFKRKFMLVILHTALLSSTFWIILELKAHIFCLYDFSEMNQIKKNWDKILTLVE